MKKPRTTPAAAWAVVLERGYSDSFIAKVEKLESLKAWRSPIRRWVASDATFAIVAMPIREGSTNIRTAYIEDRDDLPEALLSIRDFLSQCVGGGKRISFAQGGILSAETREIIQQALGELPRPWAFN